MRLRSRSFGHLSPPVIATRNRPQWLPAPARRSFSITPLRSSGQFHRSDFGNQPFTGIYEPGGPTAGPLGGTSNVGAPKVTPKMLKEHLDDFVVGQERAKKVLSTAVYNHYQRIQELQRQEDEYQELMAKKARRDMVGRHPVEGTSNLRRDDHHSDDPPVSQLERVLIINSEPDEFPGQQPTARTQSSSRQDAGIGKTLPSPDDQLDSLTLEKSNVLLLGPSGVGKTLMAKTLAKILDVPFSMSDCTPLTQAGYIGEDAEMVVQRLLAAANYDVARAETGIICLDEIDKIASAKVSHGKDVGGEGVQQALLKIIEGTTVTVQAKNEKMSPMTGRERDRNGGIPPGTGPAGSGIGGAASPGGKNEVYTVRTDNILFICTGAFIGLHKFIMDRIAKGSIGFNAPIRASNPDPSKGLHDTTIKVDSSNAELFKEHLPYWSVSPSSSSQYTHSSDAPFYKSPGDREESTFLNTLDLLTPADLQKYGLIPELIGRIPIHCALSPLSEDSLVRVLTEPRNALLKQYETLFSLSNIELRFTSGAIREVAKKAVGMGTGARGLRGVLENVLSESMFEAPGSSIKYILVTSDVIQRKSAPIHLARGQGQLFQSLITQEEDGHRNDLSSEEDETGLSNFQETREKVSASGV
jgi:ATP-dependent Clp protease ATP-binding subunit ClpX